MTWDLHSHRRRSTDWWGRAPTIIAGIGLALTALGWVMDARIDKKLEPIHQKLARIETRLGIVPDTITEK